MHWLHWGRNVQAETVGEDLFLPAAVRSVVNNEEAWNATIPCCERTSLKKE